jgi:predicted ATPase
VSRLGRLAVHGAQLLLSYWVALSAEAQGKCGRADQALGLLAEAVGLTEQSGKRWFEPELHRVRGEVMQHLPACQRMGAEGCLRQAIVVAPGSAGEILVVPRSGLARAALGRAGRPAERP